MIYACTPMRTIKIQNTDIKCWQGCGATEALIHCQWECKMVQPLQKTVRSFLIKLNLLLPTTSSCTSWYFPQKLKTLPHKILHTDNHITLIEDINNKQAVLGGTTLVCEKSLCLSQFCCEPKIALNTKVLKKKNLLIYRRVA